MKTTRYFLASLLILIILFEIAMMLIKNKYYHVNEVVLLVVLSVSLFYKSRLTWVMAVIICLSGIYNLSWVQPKYSSPTTFNFTYTIYIPLLSKAHMNVIRAIASLPIIFYLFTFIIFLTKPIRTQYLSIKGN